jgi:hypothetical protein
MVPRKKTNWAESCVLCIFSSKNIPRPSMLWFFWSEGTGNRLFCCFDIPVFLLLILIPNEAWHSLCDTLYSCRLWGGRGILYVTHCTDVDCGGRGILYVTHCTAVDYGGTRHSICDTLYSCRLWGPRHSICDPLYSCRLWGPKHSLCDPLYSCRPALRMCYRCMPTVLPGSMICNSTYEIDKIITSIMSSIIHHIAWLAPIVWLLHTLAIWSVQTNLTLKEKCYIFIFPWSLLFLHR